MTIAPISRKRVAIFPASKCDSERHLFASLAELYPIDFVREDEIAVERMDAAIFFAEAWGLPDAMFRRGVSSFRFACPGRSVALAPTASVVFSHNAVLHPALPNAQIPSVVRPASPS